MAFVDLLSWDLSMAQGFHEAVLTTVSNGTGKALKCAAVPFGLGGGLVALAAGPGWSAAEITTGLATLGGITFLPALGLMNPMTAGLVGVGALGFGVLQLASWACS